MTIALEVHALPPRMALVLATVSLLLYLGAELLALRSSSPPSAAWLLSPIVIASLYVFGLSFGAANVLFWLPGYPASLPASRALDYYWLSQTELYAIIGAAAMWIGFRSGAGEALGRALWRSPTLARLVRPTYDIRWSVVWACIGISLVARLVQVALGMYGVLGDADADGQGVRQWLNYAASTGALALLGVTVASFSNTDSSRRKWALILVTVYEMAWGVIAADKTNTILPLVLIGMVYYYTTNRLPWRYVALAFVALIGSYLVLMPMRSMEDVDARNVKAVAGAAATVVSTEVLSNTADEGSTTNLGYAILQRLNETRTASYGIRYRNLNPDDPLPKTFAERALLTPIYIMVPRAVWPDKPRRQEVGRWYYSVVLSGKSPATLSGPTFIGYLNFAGGYFAIFVGALFLGILQRGAHDRFLLAAGGGGLLINIGLLRVLGDLPSQYSDIMAVPFRLFPLLVLAQWVLFCPPRQAARSSRP